MMVDMTIDDTEHPTRDERDTLRPAFPTSAPDSFTARVPLPADAWEGGSGYGTRDTERDAARSARRDVPPAGGVGVPPKGKKPSRWQRYTAARASRARTAEQNRELEKASRAQRDATEQAVRDAAARTATEQRRASRAGQRDARRSEDIAPVPESLRKFGIWAERTIGELPMAAPLIVSGYYTMHVFHDAPLSAPWVIALLVTAGLEGGLWKLARIRFRMLIDGYSVIGLTAGIGAYLVFISGLIFGHAYFLAWDATRQALGEGMTAADVPVDWKAWGPAAGVAVISAFGVFSSSKDARYKARVELARKELLDMRAAKFAVASWFWCPWETFWAFRHSIKFRIQSPVLAVHDWRLWKITGRPDLWPVPQGFRYVQGKLIEIPGYWTEQGTAIIGTWTEHGTPIAGQRNTQLAATGHGTAGRPAAVNGTPDGTNGTRTAGHNGTRDTAPDAGHNGTANTDGGTEHAAGDGTRDTARDDTDEFADVLKLAEHLLVVTKKFDGWQTGKLPPVRGIRDAIHAHRQRVDGGSFSSMAVAAKVQEAIGRLRTRPELLDVIKVQGETAS